MASDVASGGSRRLASSWGLALMVLLLRAATAWRVTEVATSKELLQAIEAQSEHIIVRAHITFIGEVTAGAYAAAVTVGSKTRSITGRCDEEPNVTLATQRTPGQCVVEVINLSGFEFFNSASEAVWLDSLYLLVSGGLVQPQKRVAIFNEGAFPLYATKITIEGGPGMQYVSNTYAIYRSGDFFASDLKVLNFGPLDGDEVVVNVPGRVSIADSEFTGNSVTDTLGYATIWLADQIRMERCTFADNTADDVPTQCDVYVLDGSPDTDAELAEFLIFSDTARFCIGLGALFGMEVSLAPRTLGSEEEALVGFLTLQDAAFLEIKAQVEAGALFLPAVPRPSPVEDEPASPGVPPAPRVNPPGPNDATDVADASSDVVIGAIVSGFVSCALFMGVYCICRRSFLQARKSAGTGLGSFNKPPSKRSNLVELPLRAAPEAVAGSVDLDTGAAARGKKDGAPVSQMVSLTRWNGEDTVTSLETATTVSKSRASSMVQQDMVAMTRWSGDETTCAIRMVPPTPLAQSATAASEQASRWTRRGPSAPAIKVEELDDALNDMCEEGCCLLGRWRVLSAAHRRIGSQGLVQFVRDAQHSQDVVLKFFLDVAAFQREADLYWQPRVREMMAAVVDVQSNADGALKASSGVVLPPFIVLEKGRSLDEWAMVTSPDFFTCIQVLVQIAERLKALHTIGWAHRDLKPANILYRTHVGSWALIDFGCAVENGTQASIACSLPYAAPEVAQALKDGQSTMRVDTSLDIWSLGVVMWELLVKDRAFGTGRPADEIFETLTSSAPLPWEEGSGQAARMKKLGMLKDLIKVCLSRDPSERPSAEDLLHALNNLFHKVTTKALPHSAATL